MKAHKDLSFAEVRQVLTYDPLTGELRWTAHGRKGRRSDLAGTKAPNGYTVIRLAGRLRLAHRLAWLLHYGVWPDHGLDHLNGQRHDNRIANLRDVPHAANMRNHPSRRLLVGAVPGEGGGWKAAVHRYGVADDLGEFATAAQANAAWADAEKFVDDPDRPRPKVRRLAPSR